MWTEIDLSQKRSECDAQMWTETDLSQKRSECDVQMRTEIEKSKARERPTIMTLYSHKFQVFLRINTRLYPGGYRPSSYNPVRPGLTWNSVVRGNALTWRPSPVTRAPMFTLVQIDLKSRSALRTEVFTLVQIDRVRSAVKNWNACSPTRSDRYQTRFDRFQFAIFRTQFIFSLISL